MHFDGSVGSGIIDLNAQIRSMASKSSFDKTLLAGTQPKSSVFWEDFLFLDPSIRHFNGSIIVKEKSIFEQQTKDTNEETTGTDGPIMGNHCNII